MLTMTSPSSTSFALVEQRGIFESVGSVMQKDGLGVVATGAARLPRSHDGRAPVLGRESGPEVIRLSIEIRVHLLRGLRVEEQGKGSGTGEKPGERACRE